MFEAGNLRVGESNPWRDYDHPAFLQHFNEFFRERVGRCGVYAAAVAAVKSPRRPRFGLLQVADVHVRIRKEEHAMSLLSERENLRMERAQGLGAIDRVLRAVVRLAVPADPKIGASV